MTFDFPKNNSLRKYVCFVCGVSTEDMQEYRTHIIDKHEMGRDYVVCPLQRCSFPVRCVRTHFKAHHPNEVIPKVMQTKATLWRDFNGKGEKKTRRPNFREGYMVSLKNDGREMHYRSGYECEVYEALEHIEEVLSYDVEPFKVPYLFEGEKHDYHPDLVVSFTDGHTEVWEIKPSNQTDLPKNHAKWNSCDTFCKNRGWKFVVMTEKGIGKLKQAAKNKGSFNDLF